MVDTDPRQSSLPRLCSNRKCCGRYALSGSAMGQSAQNVLLPLLSVSVRSELRGVHAATRVELTYINSSQSDPLECTYTFPIEQNSVLAQFEASIEDRCIVTKVEDKQQAKEKYDDAVAGGKAAVLAERKLQDEVMTVKLGNLLPGQRVTLKSTILSKLEVYHGYLNFSLPMAYFPDYKRHGVDGSAASNYSFDYEVMILSDHAVTGLFLPENTQLVEKDESSRRLKICATQPGRSMELFYRTYDMQIPSLIYAESEDNSDQVAVSASFVLTLDPSQPQDALEVLEDERPEQITLSEGADYHFTFIIDRSGSMGGQNRMRLAINALTIFIQSLPLGCRFSIISFGSRFDYLLINGTDMPVYDESTKSEAIKQISGFIDNYGGTDIRQPLQNAQEKWSNGRRKRIFLLTDGQVMYPQQVVQQAQQHNDTARVYTFGLGSGCDQAMVREVALAGRGTSTIVKDNDASLNGIVVKALSNAISESLEAGSFGFTGQMSEPEEIYRNKVVSASALLTRSQFSKLYFEFRAKAPETGGDLLLRFDWTQFSKVEQGQASSDLFKIAAQAEIAKLQKKSSKEQARALSLKYQILCDQTAIVGVIRQPEKISGVLLETRIDFERKKLALAREERRSSNIDMLKQQLAVRFSTMMSAKSKKLFDSSDEESDSDSSDDSSDDSSRPRRSKPVPKQKPQVEVPCVKPEPKSLGSSIATITAPTSNAPTSKAGPSQMQQISNEFTHVPEANIQICGLLTDDEEDEIRSTMDSYTRTQAKLAGKASLAAALASQSLKKAAPKTASLFTIVNGQKVGFQQFIMGVLADGSWHATSYEYMKACMKEGQTEDEQVWEALRQSNLKEGVCAQEVYLTLLAWFILREVYADHEDEWSLIARKSRTWLINAGLAKPDSLVNKFTLLFNC